MVDGGAGIRAIPVLALSALWLMSGDPARAGTDPDLTGPEAASTDLSAAFRQWLPRALHGDAQAAHALGAAYASGAGRAEDYAEAARWFRKAAELGSPRARSDLAGLYAKGLGVAQDYVQAYVWFELAAAGFEHGLRRDQAIELHDMMAAFMTPDQRAEARRLVEAWRTELD